MTKLKLYNGIAISICVYFRQITKMTATNKSALEQKQKTWQEMKIVDKILRIHSRYTFKFLVDTCYTISFKDTVILFDCQVYFGQVYF